jgi:hypothetical protein
MSKFDEKLDEQIERMISNMDDATFDALCEAAHIPPAQRAEFKKHVRRQVKGKTH